MHPTVFRPQALSPDLFTIQKSHTVKQRKWSVMSYSNWNLSAVSCKILGLRVRVPLSRSYMSLQYHAETNKQKKTLEMMNTTWQRFPEDYLLLFICLHKHLFLWYKKGHIGCVISENQWVWKPLKNIWRYFVNWKHIKFGA